jgi:hypothetical protein
MPRLIRSAAASDIVRKNISTKKREEFNRTGKCMCSLRNAIDHLNAGYYLRIDYVFVTDFKLCCENSKDFIQVFNN